MLSSKKICVAILASGSGTNAQNLIRYFRNHEKIEMALVISNRGDAFVLDRAEMENVPSAVIPKALWDDKEYVTGILQKYNIHFLVLAGYLLLIPSWIVSLYSGRIINIHPSLLPKYGGKGLYGDKVHQAVLSSGDSKSGITIHYVNEEYDSGDIIFQSECDVYASDTPETLAARIHELEYFHFPRVVEEVIQSNL